MTLSITYDGGSISSNTSFSTFEFVEMAYRGEVGQGSITIDDATATRNIVGLKTVIATESQDVTDTRLFTGLTERRGLGRSDSRVAASERDWTVTLTDMNDVLRERVITSGNRPAETDVARVHWLVGSGFLPDVLGTYVSLSNPVTLPATNYAGRYGFDVLTDCQDASSKNFFVTWHGSSLALFYDADTSSNFASTLRISDTPADIDYVTTFPPDWDNNPGLERDPGEVYSGMWLEYNGGHIFYRSGAVASNFRQREVSLFNDRPKTATQATTLATKLVSQQSVEEDRITLSIHVDRQYANIVRAGQRVLLKARSIGVTTFTAYRVVRKSTKPGRVEGGSPTRYTLNLELAAPKKIKNRLHSVGKPSGIIPVVAYTCSSCSAHTQADRDADATTGTSWTTNNTGLTRISSMANVSGTPSDVLTPYSTTGPNFARSPSADTGGLTALFTSSYQGPTPFPGDPFYVSDNEMRNYVSFNIGAAGVFPFQTLWFRGNLYLDTSWSGTGQTAARALLPATAWDLVAVYYGTTSLFSYGDGGLNFPGGARALSMESFEQTVIASGVHPGGYNVPQPIAAAVPYDDATGYVALFLRVLGSQGVAYNDSNVAEVIPRYPEHGTTTYHATSAGLSVSIPTYTLNICGCAVSGQASSGQWYPATVIGTGDSSTTSFSVPTGYVAGSLIVWVDGIRQDATEVSAAAGTFTLSFAPLAASGTASAEVVTASWVVA